MDIDKAGWYYFGIGDLNGGSYNAEYTFKLIDWIWSPALFAGISIYFLSFLKVAIRLMLRINEYPILRKV